jgi:hypothetical protein
MWMDENRARYDRSQLRYPSDVTDAEWAYVEPLIPPARRGGAKRTVNVREVVNGSCTSSAPAASGAPFLRIVRFSVDGKTDRTDCVPPVVR